MAVHDNRFQLLLTADERQMLKALANKDGVAEGQVLRGLMRKAFEASGLTLPKKTTTKS